MIFYFLDLWLPLTLVIQYSKYQSLDTQVIALLFKIHPVGLGGEKGRRRCYVTCIAGVQSPAVARRAAVCIGI